ncbi:UNVERIFIED_CONTAM: hypothetical protein Slati_0210500 [Sesamum latifolium]|uniref:Uncharacterized protein n=1 Tax=Sesamum latifolium TaxID=2727402 RepID=A0AAW2YC47_9LAMI
MLSANGVAAFFLDIHVGLANALEPDGEGPPEVPESPLPTEQDLIRVDLTDQVMEDVLHLRTAPLLQLVKEVSLSC